MRLAFGNCIFDLEARQVWRAGAPQTLEPKMFALLEVLIQRRPGVVKNEELDELLWPKVYVARTSLTRLVSELRAVLGDTPRDSKIIRTVYKSGYAFGANVATLDAGSEAASNQSVVFSLIWNDRASSLPDGDYVLGRGDECQIVIDAETVSRCHARICVRGGTASIEDLGSTNGTSLNGQRITAATPVPQRAEISLGTARVVVRKRDAAMETVQVTDSDRDRLMLPGRS